MSKTQYDVVIIGGALMGGSTAFHLLSREPGLRVCVVERDPTYKNAPSAVSVAGIRVLFSQPENLLMSRYGHEFYSRFGELTSVDGTVQPLHFWKRGYLFIANTPEQADDMRANFDFQTTMGCQAELHDANSLRRRFPSISTHDVAAAVLSPQDGWIDPFGALTGLRRKAKALGAEYRHDEAVGLAHDGTRVTAVALASGAMIFGDYVVNTAGIWAPEVCRMVGIEIPVVPLPRTQFYFETHAEFEPLPLVRDQLGPGFRPEGAGFISGLTNYDAAGEFRWDVNYDYFDEVIWPALVNRVPKFESLKVKNGWAGHYAQNVFDGNLLLGPWPGHLQNFLIATGCSGHGLQHAPAIGRAISELIIDGGFTTLDLSRLSLQRLIDNTPYLERGVKA